MSLPRDRWWSSFPDDPDGLSSSALNYVAAYDVDEVYDEWDIIVIHRWWRSLYTIHDHSSSSNGPWHLILWSIGWILVKLSRLSLLIILTTGGLLGTSEVQRDRLLSLGYLMIKLFLQSRRFLFVFVLQLHLGLIA